MLSDPELIIDLDNHGKNSRIRLVATKIGRFVISMKLEFPINVTKFAPQLPPPDQPDLNAVAHALNSNVGLYRTHQATFWL